MPSGPPLLDVLRARGMLHQHSDGLVDHLARGPIVAYCGFDPTGDFAGHLGQRSMRERATRLGGTVDVESAPGCGTTVRARLPYPVA